MKPILSKSFDKYKSLLWLITLSILVVPLWQNSTIAQEKAKSVIASSQLKVTFDPPAEDQPKSTTGGASRSIDQCSSQVNNDDIPFSALLPVSTQGLTTVSHPTILAYLPETSANKAFFSWRDEENNDHYQAILPIKKKGGIIALSLPKNAPALKIGQNYKWALGIMCEGRLKPDSPMIQGQIKRVELTPELQKNLDDNISLKNAVLYGDNGLWYETVATMAQLKIAQPNNQTLASNWDELLRSVGLEKMAKVPLNIKQANNK